MRKKELNIVDGPIFSNLIIYTIPIILAGMLQLLYNAADIIVVGRFAGSSSLAAVSATGQMINLSTNLFIGLSSGAAVTVSYYIGARDNKAVQDSVHTSVFIAAAGGIILAVIGIPLAKTLLAIINTPYDIIDEATRYMQIIFAGMPASLLYNFGSAILRSSGDTKTPLIILSASGIINIILNLVFVIVFKMGAEGVGFATVISQIISAVCVLFFLTKLNNGCKLCFHKIRIHAYVFLRILKIGIPAGVQGILFSLSNTLIQSSVNSFGSDTVAGSGAALNLTGFCYTAMNAMHQSVITFVGQSVGAKRFDRLKKIISIACIQVTFIGLAISAFILIFDHQLLSLYAPGNEAVIAQGIIKLKYEMPLYFTGGIMETLVGASRGMGSSFLPMVASVLGVCGIRVLWIYTVFQKYRTLEVLFISYPFSWIVTSLIQLVFTVVILKKLLSENNKTAEANVLPLS